MKRTSQSCFIVKVSDEQIQRCVNPFVLKLKFKKGSVCSNSNLPRLGYTIWFNKFNDTILDMLARTMLAIGSQAHLEDQRKTYKRYEL